MKKLISMIVSATFCAVTMADEIKPEQPTGAAVGGLLGGAAGQVIQEQEAEARQKQLEETLEKLKDTAWRLVRIGENASAEGVSSTIRFGAEGTAGGSTGVNRYHGAFKLENGSLKAGPFMMTQRAGEPDAMTQESNFLAALATVRGVSVEDEKLVIHSACGCGCDGGCNETKVCDSCGDACECKDGCKAKVDLVFEPVASE